MKTPALILAAMFSTALAPTVRAQTVESAVAAATPGESGSESFRIGFWEIDLFAVDHEPRGSTFRFLDFKIFRLLEIGQGSDYQAFSLFEMPELLTLFASRREGATRELRVFDLQAIALALVRQVETDAGESQSHILKLPIIGSVVSSETDEEQPEVEHQTYMFLVRRDVKQAPKAISASRSSTHPWGWRPPLPHLAADGTGVPPGRARLAFSLLVASRLGRGDRAQNRLRPGDATDSPEHPARPRRDVEGTP
jgi:hypothetical protein